MSFCRVKSTKNDPSVLLYTAQEELFERDIYFQLGTGLLQPLHGPAYMESTCGSVVYIWWHSCHTSCSAVSYRACGGL